MEIHSSSLALIPARNNATNKHDETRLSNNDRVDSQKSLILPPLQETEKNFNAKEFQQLSEDIEKQQNRPTNSHTAHALDVYTQQNTQLIKNQRSELISGIDLFA